MTYRTGYDIFTVYNFSPKLVLICLFVLMRKQNKQKILLGHRSENSGAGVNNRQ